LAAVPIAARLHALLRRLDADGEAPARSLRDELDELLREIEQLEQGWHDAARVEEELVQVKKMEALGRLASGIAHDFNNLLMGIMGCCRLAERKLTPDSPARAYLEEMRAGAERGTTMTRQLLSFSRKRPDLARRISLNEVVRSATELIRPLLGEHIDVHLRLAEADPAIVADPSHIEQILMNLGSNARDAMPAGGRLTVETGLRTLSKSELGARSDKRPGLWVRLAVRDTGHGMDATTLARAFEPFFTTKRAEQGTGLGLATVYGLVEQLGGFIQVESGIDQGAAFTIFLPRARAVDASPPPEPARAAPRSELTVLVVEDERLVRMTVCDYLKGGGFVVLAAPSPAEAIALADHHPGPIDLLLTDMVMPGMNGRALAETLLARRPELKVLFMSAYPGEWLVEHGHLEPGVATLGKPFTSEILLRQIGEILGAA
jgi:two-component system, cell cycle sensor histidine kinase and response regulator CckA